MWFEKLTNSKREMRKETQKRKEKTQNNLNQMENGTSKNMCSKILKNKRKEKRHKEDIVKKKETNK